MKAKFIKIINIISLVFISTFISFNIAYWVGETYFFDKFFYFKSIDHGYYIPNKQLTLESFGERSADLVELKDQYYNKINNNILGKSSGTDDIFTIALIGDSYTWGTGLKYNSTLPFQLEKKLEKVTPVNVISLAEMGDSILEYWENFKIADSKYDIDLFIFVAVSNDLIFKNKIDYHHLNYSQSIPFWKECKVIFPEIEPDFDFSGNGKEISNADYLDLESRSWKNAFHICLLEESLKQFPKNKTLFFITDYYFEDEDSSWEKYIYYLKKSGIKTVYSREGIHIDKYKSLWTTPEKFYTSKKERHPSKKAQEMYADILYTEIINNYLE